MGTASATKGAGGWKGEAVVDRLVDKVDKIAHRQEATEKAILEMARPKDDPVGLLQKALRDGRGGPPVVVGFDGGDTLGTLRLCSTRQKALGWGRFLSTVQQVGARRDIEGAEKALEHMGARSVHKAPLAEGSGPTGGYTVPIEFYRNLMRIVAEEAFFRSRCTTIPMGSQTIQVPALNQTAVPAAGTSAFFGGLAASWTPEAGPKPESEPIFDQVTLTARDLVFHTVASHNLLMDNAIGLDTLLTTLFTEAMAWFYDYYALRGTGSSQPLGVLNAPGQFLAPRATALQVGVIDLAGMMAHLVASSWKSAIWIMHPSVLPELIRMTATATGNLLWLNPAPNTTSEGPLAQPLPMTVLGLPAFFTEKLPVLGAKGDVMLVDPSKYLIGDRLNVQIESSEHVKFLTNQTVWRIVCRWDGQPWLKLPITLADRAYQVSPFVVLNAGA